jgi:hypothetical protein
VGIWNLLVLGCKAQTGAVTTIPLAPYQHFLCHYILVYSFPPSCRGCLTYILLHRIALHGGWALSWYPVAIGWLSVTYPVLLVLNANQMLDTHALGPVSHSVREMKLPWRTLANVRRQTLWLYAFPPRIVVGIRKRHHETIDV